MSLSRRGFLKVAFAAGAASAVPLVIGEWLPTIYGDGIHDDTEGFQAAAHGKDVCCRKGVVKLVDGCFTISGGTYLVTKHIHIKDMKTFKLKDVTFIGGANFYWDQPESEWLSKAHDYANQTCKGSLT